MMFHDDNTGPLYHLVALCIHITPQGVPSDWDKKMLCVAMKLVFWIGWAQRKTSSVPFTHFLTMCHASKTIEGLIGIFVTCDECLIYMCVSTYGLHNSCMLQRRLANKVRLNPIVPPLRQILNRMNKLFVMNHDVIQI